jgi:hypothetical protein
MNDYRVRVRTPDDPAPRWTAVGEAPIGQRYTYRSGDIAVEVDFRRDSLDAAWAEAEAALPEGWMGPSLAEQTEGNWRAYSARRHSSPPEIITTVGPTPAAALRALAVKLRSLPVMDRP